MASYTEKYKLKKPAATDFVDITDINGNTDIIEAELAKRPALGADGKLPSGAIPAVTSAAIETALGYKPVNVFYVTVTSSLSGDIIYGVSDKTGAEIYAAYMAGSPVFCNAVSTTHYDGLPITLPLFVVTKNGDSYQFFFSGAGAVPSGADTTIGTVTVMVSDEVVMIYASAAKTTDIPTALPNPQDLTLRLGNKDTVYNGSSSKLFEVPAPDELIFSTVTTEAVQTFTTTTDNSGQAFSLKKWRLEIYFPYANPGNAWSNINITVPGLGYVQCRSASSRGGAEFVYEGNAGSGVGWYICTAGDNGAVSQDVVSVTEELSSVTITSVGDRPLPVGVKITLKGVRA